MEARQGPLILLCLLLAGCGPDWRQVKSGPGLSAVEQHTLAQQADALFAAPRSLARVQRAFTARQRLVAADKNNRDYLVEAAIVASWLARHQSSAPVAQLGVEYAGAALELNETDAAAHFYRAVCLGLYTQSRTGGALTHVKQMAHHARRTVALDPKFNHAGGHRYLCRLLAQAPEFPISIGDSEAAVEHGRKAIAIAPDYPENHLALAAAYAEDEQPEQAAAQAKRMLALLAEGGYWEDSEAWRAEAKKILGR